MVRYGKVSWQGKGRRVKVNSDSEQDGKYINKGREGRKEG